MTSILRREDSNLVPHKLIEDYEQLLTKTNPTPEEAKRSLVYSELFNARRAYSATFDEVNRLRAEVRPVNIAAINTGLAGTMVGIVASAILVIASIVMGLGVPLILIAAVCLLGSSAGFGALLTIRFPLN